MSGWRVWDFLRLRRLVGTTRTRSRTPMAHPYLPLSLTQPTFSAFSVRLARPALQKHIFHHFLYFFYVCYFSNRRLVGVVAAVDSHDETLFFFVLFHFHITGDHVTNR